MSESQTNHTNFIPSYLEPGDKVLLVAPAKKIDPSYFAEARQLFESWGLELIIGANAANEWHQFAGTDDERREDMQWALDHSEAKAIICARGGYGSVRIIDGLDWATFEKNPKWLVGFSDITVFHSHLNRVIACCSIHGTVPLNFDSTAPESLETLRKTLFGDLPNFAWNHNKLNVQGRAYGELVGGNLAILVSLAASQSMISTKGKILFIEEVGEYAYSFDRMMQQLKRSGVLTELKGLLVGGLTNIKEAKDHFGFTPEEIIREVCKDYSFPIAFDFPAGHQEQNRSIVLGHRYSLVVDREGSTLRAD